MTITDRNTGEEYFRTEEHENYAEFSYNGQIRNYLQWQEMNWAGTDKEGNPLPDGTEVEVKLMAIPSYYDDVEDPSTLTGKGLFLASTPFTIDNQTPELVDGYRNEDGTFSLVINDNRYTACVMVYDRSANIIGRYSVNQEEKGVDTVVTIDAPEDVFYIDVVDYALNEIVYRVNNTGHEDTTYVGSITIDQGEEATVDYFDYIEFTATVGPEWLAEGA